MSPVLLASNRTDAAGIGWAYVDSTCVLSYQVYILSLIKSVTMFFRIAVMYILYILRSYFLLCIQQVKNALAVAILKHFFVLSAGPGDRSGCCRRVYPYLSGLPHGRSRESSGHDAQQGEGAEEVQGSGGGGRDDLAGAQVDPGQDGRGRRSPRGGPGGREQDTGQDHQCESITECLGVALDAIKVLADCRFVCQAIACPATPARSWN